MIILTEKKTKLQKYSAPALEKGLDILEFLSVTDTKPTLSQLATSIGRSKSEIFRMMIVLEERGYIGRTDGDLFVLTDKLRQLSGDRPEVNRLVDIAAPTLDILADQTELSNHLSVIKGQSLVVVRSTAVSQSYALSVQVGYESDILGTSAGACFLSDLTDVTDRQTAVKLLSKSTKSQSATEFDDLVKRCIADGCVIAKNPINHSIYELSAPIRHAASKHTLAALTLPFVGQDRISNQISDIQEKVFAAVEQIEKQLAFAISGLSLSTVDDLILSS